MDRMKGLFWLMESIELVREDKRGNGRYYRRRLRVFPRFKNQESNLCSMFWSKPVNVPAVVYEQVI